MARRLVLSLMCLGASVMGMVQVVQQPALPHPWTLLQKAEKLTTVPIVIALHPRDPQLLTRIATEVSEPSHPNYGHHLTNEQLREIVAPSHEVLKNVSAWLRASSVEYKVGATGDMFHIKPTVEQAERLFGTQFHVVRNMETQQVTMRGGNVFVPPHVAPYVKAVFGVHGLPLPPKGRMAPSDSAYPVTPDVILKTYDVSGVKPSGSVKNKQAVAEFQGQYMNTSDLEIFFKKYVPNAQPGDEKVYKFVGPQLNGEGIEALLDIEYIMGVAPHVLTEFWEYPAYQFCSDLVQWTQAILADTEVPNVHSVSYGWQGELSQVGCAAGDVDTVDAEFQKIAAKGITILFASGDSGSGEGNTQPAKLYPSWPASSPWVTAVGSTRFVNQKPGAEMATDQFGSGGGFSTMFPQPEWQKEAVAGYFAVEPADKLPPATSYPKGGRATPDLAALGEGYQVVTAGGVESVGGTSASTPAFGGLISLINEKRIAAGKKPLGFLNPWIYKNADAFIDVTVGDNRWGRGPFRLKDGWDCVKGWDPATGFGTPNFPKLLASALALP